MTSLTLPRNSAGVAQVPTTQTKQEPGSKLWPPAAQNAFLGAVYLLGAALIAGLAYVGWTAVTTSPSEALTKQVEQALGQVYGDASGEVEVVAALRAMATDLDLDDTWVATVNFAAPQTGPRAGIEAKDRLTLFVPDVNKCFTTISKVFGTSQTATCTLTPILNQGRTSPGADHRIVEVTAKTVTDITPR